MSGMPMSIHLESQWDNGDLNGKAFSKTWLSIEFTKICNCQTSRNCLPIKNALPILFLMPTHFPTDESDSIL